MVMAMAMAMAMASLPGALSPPPALSNSRRRHFNSLPLELVRINFSSPAMFSSPLSGRGCETSASRFRIRAVSVSGDTAQKEVDVKKMSYRPIVILPVRVVLQNSFAY